MKAWYTILSQDKISGNGVFIESPSIHLDISFAKIPQRYLTARILPRSMNLSVTFWNWWRLERDQNVNITKLLQLSCAQGTVRATRKNSNDFYERSLSIRLRYYFLLRMCVALGRSSAEIVCDNEMRSGVRKASGKWNISHGEWNIQLPISDRPWWNNVARRLNSLPSQIVC